jgi:hypothetical protein
MIRSFVRVAILALAFASPGTAFASNSFKLATTLLGWERVYAGPTFVAGSDLARRAAWRFGHYCTMPEVFVRSGTTSLFMARGYFAWSLPRDAQERVLLDLMTQRVTLLTAPRLRSAVLSVLVPTRSGVMLALC